MLGPVHRFSLRSGGLIQQGLPPSHAGIPRKRTEVAGPGLDISCAERLGRGLVMVPQDGERKEQPLPQACSFQTLWGHQVHAVEVSFGVGMGGAQWSSTYIVSIISIFGPTKRQ